MTALRFRATGISEPPSARCWSCGIVDGCDCEDGNCPRCGGEARRNRMVSCFVCGDCGNIFEREEERNEQAKR